MLPWFLLIFIQSTSELIRIRLVNEILISAFDLNVNFSYFWFPFDFLEHKQYTKLVAYIYVPGSQAELRLKSCAFINLSIRQIFAAIYYMPGIQDEKDPVLTPMRLLAQWREEMWTHNCWGKHLRDVSHSNLVTSTDIGHTSAPSNGWGVEGGSYIIKRQEMRHN